MTGPNTPQPPSSGAGGVPGMPAAQRSSVDSPAERPSGTTDDASAQGGESTALAGRALHESSGPPVAATGLPRAGMFGATGSGDTSGYGLLVREPYVPPVAERPYGGPTTSHLARDERAYGVFDEVTDALFAAMAQRSIPESAIRQITVAAREITYYVAREHLTALLWALRDDEALRFELASSISGVDYGVDVPQRLHVVYELTSMTYRRRIRLEVAVDVDDPYVPSAVAVYPTADWHERECWDMFGVVFSGHPALTRILMPDDWPGHPQRKDYPLGGIPVEYKGAEIPPPDQRRTYS